MIPSKSPLLIVLRTKQSPWSVGVFVERSEMVANLISQDFAGPHGTSSTLLAEIEDCGIVVTAPMWTTEFTKEIRH